MAVKNLTAKACGPSRRANDKTVRQRSFAPPSVLPDISPTRGEIGCSSAPPYPATLEICESRRDV
ncbi:hypothetical protein EN827_08070 [Mesorhizobium sp. M1D.F.Ca.ET.184.01.1.1]|nr:hypothetical protein EN874_008070 [Mesorhizobium sp. M1D.F.Ca.ET.231.01.1.1]TGP36383.1 hypothetical protein EN877_08070 [Mesorhizobium sp. M1D.F.Ca.ET.234.01.1.1]TGS49887.1 hypothetical protein EN827_08070 [Mesorhizobium sp. M1D.F.Ca.ET.184.01.1.1]TGS64598.1 hypothetical protein EN826_008070 [Mesorhizobium sp. M1D.F.Ca.ET.183.01.1.1]